MARRADREGREGAGGTTAIEFLPPDDRAFGDADGATFAGLDDEPDWDAGADDDLLRPRWATLLAGLAVLGLLTAGVMAAAPWAGDDTAATPTTTPATVASTVPTPDAGDGPTTATTPVPTTIDPTVRGWLLDPPVAGQRLVSVIDPGEFRDPVPQGWGEVWASPGATRASGRWISMTLTDGRGPEPFDPVEASSIPIDDGGRPGRAAIGRDGVVQVRVQRRGDDGERFIGVDAFGVTLPELLAFTESLTIDAGRPGADDDRPVAGSTSLLDGLERIAGRPTSIDLVDAVLFGPSAGAGTYYVGPDPRDITLLRDRPASEVDPRLDALAFTTGLADGSSPWATFDGFTPDAYVVGERIAERYQLRVVRVTVDDEEILLVTTLAAGALPAMLDDLRLVTAEDWAAARDRSQQAPGFTELPRDDSRTRIGDGTLSGGADWSVDVFAPSGDVTVSGSGFRLEPRPLSSLIGTDRQGAIGTAVVDGVAIVVGASSVDGAELRIRAADGSERTSELIDVDAPVEPPTEPGRLDESFWTSWEGTRMVAVSVETITPGTPFVARMVAPDGSVLASFDPWLLGGDA